MAYFIMNACGDAWGGDMWGGDVWVKCDLIVRDSVDRKLP